jgi:transposase
LLPVAVAVSSEGETREPAGQQQLTTSGSIQIEFPGRAMISIECGADPALLRSILESLRKSLIFAPGPKSGSQPA